MAKRKRRSFKNLIPCKRTKYDHCLSNRDVNLDSNVAESNHISLPSQKPKPFCCLEDLIELSQEKSTKVKNILIEQQEAFTDLLESNLDSDWIVTTVAILSKMCSCHFDAEKCIIMSIAAKSSFTDTLENYLLKLQPEEQENHQLLSSNVDEFFVNLTEVFKYWIESIPTAYKLLLKLIKAIDVSISSVEKLHSVAVSDSTKSKVKTVIEKFTIKKLELKDFDFLPNDFRNMTVYPTREEILSTKPGIVQKNIIKGSYDSMYHYLDVQFRLLKEDFLASIRRGIAEYLDRKSEISHTTQFSDVIIHPDVVFRSLVFQKGTEGVTLDFFDEINFNQISSSGINRFITGSLVLFTKDNFSSILCGRVIAGSLKKRPIVVSFDSEYNSYEFNVSYLMVECESFFEPYYQVLKALQWKSHFDFPMKRYLVDTVPAVESPGYLDTSSSLYELQSIKNVDLFGDNWPTANQLCLDPTQYSAFKAALTQKFAVIQGPPGTGKTYLGLRIVKTLLCNSQFWYDNTPILVVSLTNHALDQFLEGLISTTTRILRVGGQSRNENLKKFNLIHARKRHGGRNKWKTEMEDILTAVTEYNENLKILEDYTCVIAVKNFVNIDQNINFSWFAHASNSDLLAWLFPSPMSANSKFDFLTFRENSGNGSKPTILVSISSMEEDIAKIQNYLQNFNSEYITQIGVYFKKWELESYLEDVQKKLQYFKMRIHDRATLPVSSKPPNVDYYAPHRMHPNDRWNLYFYWLNLYHQDVSQKLFELRNKYAEISTLHKRDRNMRDMKIMQRMLVVGMTTTTAARLQTTLQNLKCQIVIVEEAAQVLESHVTVSVTNHCQHLILLGDHQQLRPTTADYHIEKNFNLGISMFERMVINKMQCHILGVQYRMRPEIAQLIVPHIYPELKNHDSVSYFPPIIGMNFNLFFIHHEHQEIEDDESKSNLFEVKYLISLACYLRQVGYKPEDITILSAYSGQMFSLLEEREKHKHLLYGVKIVVVDNYQGEENKIILLSLVRNNRQGKIGFLRSEHRVCVALSRAKEGLYIMGNMDLLCQNSEIWPKIKQVLIRQNCLGNYLTVSCRFHRDQITKIKEPKDFDRALDGSCSEKCGSLMKCGHKCTKSCHTIDRDHTKTKCTEPCLKELCNKGHQCPKLCYQDCDPCMANILRRLECNHEIVLPCSFDPNESILCKVSVNVTLPCGHNVSNKPCHIDASNWKCDFICNKRVEPCGHSCPFYCHANNDPDHLIQYRCSKPCEKIAPGCASNKHRCQHVCYEDCRPCNVPVKKNLPNCKHSQVLFCSTDVNAVKCFELCNKFLPCGHKCPKKCYNACGGCRRIVWKRLPDCGHMVKTLCKYPPNILNCRGWCPKRLACGHYCKKKCYERCTTKCQKMVDLLEAAPCGHKFEILCSIRSTILPGNTSVVQYCKEACTQILECSHKCLGTCGKCYQDGIHLACPKKCQIHLPCGHKDWINCKDVGKVWKHKCSKCPNMIETMRAHCM